MQNLFKQHKKKTIAVFLLLAIVAARLAGLPLPLESLLPLAIDLLTSADDDDDFVDEGVDDEVTPALPNEAPEITDDDLVPVALPPRLGVGVGSPRPTSARLFAFASVA